jgi:hypothetical protein
MQRILGSLIREVQEKGEIATQSIGDSHRGCAEFWVGAEDIDLWLPAGEGQFVDTGTRNHNHFLWSAKGVHDSDTLHAGLQPRYRLAHVSDLQYLRLVDSCGGL